MNDEAAFQAHLDAHPHDHTARLVFADWLQERDDHRAEGYRAMGRLRKWPYRNSDGGWVFWNAQHYPDSWHKDHFIPGDWFAEAAWNSSFLWLRRNDRSDLENVFAEGWLDVANRVRFILLAQGVQA